MWLGAVGVGVLCNFVFHQYRFSLYNRNPDYPQFRPLQHLQYEMFWATVAVITVGGVWVAWLKLRGR